MTRFVLALDQGTSSSRAILFNEQGEIVNERREIFRQIFPQPGWVEHDPWDIWQSQLSAARAVLQVSGVRPEEIAAIGITNQRETTVVWDRRTGRPIGNAIVWQCRRTAPFCEQLLQSGQALSIQQKTGLIVDAYFSGSKLKWLLDHVPSAREQAEHGNLAFGTIDSWLLWNLTGGKKHATDFSNASRTMLFNIHEGRWDRELLSLFDIPVAILPEVQPSSHLFGHTDVALFGAPIPISGMIGDQQAALFGQACFTPGMAKNTYGTGSFMLLHTGPRAVTSESGLISTIAWNLNGKIEYALEGSVFVTGAAVQWLRDELGLIEKAADTEALALQVPDTGGVYFVPAFAGLGAPYWDPLARGLLVGLTRGTTAAHVARATLEAICYQSLDVLQAMQKDAGITLASLRVDGGAAANDFLMQFQADILGVPVERPTIVETTAAGAAYLAGLAAGVWNSQEQISAMRSDVSAFWPRMDAVKRKQLYAHWKRAVNLARGWAQHEDP